MSLMQLLTASKSVLNIKDEPSRYRMSERKLLPKFGPAPKAEREKQMAPPKEGRRKKDLMAKDTTENAGKRERFMTRWMKLANPFARRAAAAPPKLPVQSELHLDAVKPVRNDLHETDLLVVRREPAEKAAAASGKSENAREKTDAGLAGKK
jgi:hypothetical protein